MRLIYEWFENENYIELILSQKEIEQMPSRALVKNFLVHDGRGVLNVLIRKEIREDVIEKRVE